MKLLVYYKNKTEFVHLNEIVDKLSLEVNIDETDDFETILEHYDNNNFYDIVFLDFACDNCELIIDHITKKRLHQKIILLNDVYNCYNHKNCTYCKKHMNIKTVIKPLNLFQIGSLFNNDFECESYQKNEQEFNLERVVKSIVNKYPFVNFNQHDYLFDLSLIVNPLKSSILIELINILEKNGIEHYLLDDILHIVHLQECKKVL